MANNKKKRVNIARDKNAVSAARAKQAFERLRAEIDAIDPKDVEPRRVDLREAAFTVLLVCRELAAPESRELFEVLAKHGLFDIEHYRRLEDTAWAAWHADLQLQLEAAAGRARVPAELLDAATELKKRMLKVAEYHFDGDPAVAPRLEAARTGPGYRALISGLLVLAEVYEERRRRLAGDHELYRPEDQARALELAEQLTAHLGPTAVDGGEWNDLASRTWTLLARHYEEVRTAGLFIYRSSGGEKKLPSLVTANRSRPAHARARPKVDAPAPTTEAPKNGGLNGATAPAAPPVHA